MSAREQRARARNDLRLEREKMDLVDPNNPGEEPPTVQQLLQIIQQQNVSLVNQMAALQQMQEERRRSNEEAALAKQAEKQARQDLVQAVAQVEGEGGIYGFDSGRPLTVEERSFHLLLTGLGINKDTADEVFRQGLTGTDALKRINADKLKNIIYNITRNKSPKCPDPKKVFLGAAFEDKITVLISWIKFQRIIGGATNASAWIADPQAATKTIERVQFYHEIKDSEGTEDISLPEPLTEMKKFRDFREHLLTYLRIKRGAANVPLTYVVRDEAEVTDVNRAGSVGSSEQDTYKNWDEYAIRCTVHQGTHWDSDNTSLWQIISKLLRDGPGWDYIRSYERVGDGDGRGAYKSITEQAFQYSNVRLMRQEARENLRKLKYSGPSRNWNYEKYVRHWLRNIKTLKEFGDCPSEESLVSDFCGAISDPRLTSAISHVLQEGSGYVANFEKTQKYLNMVLSVTTQNESSNRRVSATQFKGNGASDSGRDGSSTKGTFNGKLEAKDYTPNEWFSMNQQQRNRVKKLRRQAYAAERKRKAAAVDTGGTGKENKDAGNQFGSAAHAAKKQKGKQKEQDGSN